MRSCSKFKYVANYDFTDVVTNDNTFQNFIDTLVDKHLDLTLSRTQQVSGKKQLLYNQV